MKNVVTQITAQADKHRRRWWTLGVLSLSLIIIGMDNTVLNVAIPTLQREVDASASMLQWMVDSYLLVFAGVLLAIGALGDRFGRALMLRIGLVVFAGAALGAVFAETAGQIIAARAAMGLDGAMIMQMDHSRAIWGVSSRQQVTSSAVDRHPGG